MTRQYFKNITAESIGNNLENLLLLGNAAINGTGNVLANTITGNTAANVLDGGAGIDTLAGGLGDDTYVVDQTGDVVMEAAGSGTDLVKSSIGYVLSANVENLVLTGTAVISGTGNALSNVLDGSLNTAANVLSGSAGDDTYVLGAGDTVVEAAGGGTDEVRTALNCTLASNVENLVLTGTAAINGTGNALGNVLTGNAAANVLDGGAGADTLAGGAGDDTYVVDSASDVVIEAAGAGSDTVQSSVSWTLGDNIERLVLTGTAAINGTGNALGNVLTGNAAANVLDGGVGADTLAGGAGDDTYVVDSASDVVTEAAGAGSDTVQSSVSWTLGDNVERLVLTGTAAINGAGNALGNVLDGSLNTAANVLSGGAGDDTYMLGAGDTVVEAAGSGIDVVRTALNCTLAANVENLVLTGTAAVNGTGNALVNALTGNAAANVLDGGAGSDTLAGGAGNDTLVGGTGLDSMSGGSGQDTFRFTGLFAGGASVDTINDFSSVDDKLEFDHAFFALGATGRLAAGRLAFGTKALDLDDRLVYDRASGQLYYDDDGSGAHTAVLIAKLGVNTTLIAENLFII